MSIKSKLFFLPIRVISIGSIVFGLVFFVAVFDDFFDSLKSISWPAVSGKIIESSVKQRKHTTSMSGHSTVYSYDVTATFQYRVNGNLYESNNIRFGGYTAKNPRLLDGTLSNYKAEKVVDVYYSPDNPSNSVLEPGFNKSIAFAIFAGCLFIILGILFYVYMPKLFKTKEG